MNQRRTTGAHDEMTVSSGPMEPSPAMIMLDSNSQDVSGWIFNIQRFSLHDGPGIRTTLFLKG